ncbi:MAG: single-stranded-DNA-specific exonuclease RecJ [Polyangiales bacterium]
MEPSPDADSLARALRLHPLVARVLVGRGVRAPEDARRYLSPRLNELSRPEAMADRDLAADRLAAAIRRRERVVVFGDYDVDGITSSALLTRVLRRLGGDVTALVASRFEGGYGLSDAALQRVLAERPAVVVTCDCGTSDHPRLASLRACGVDAIVVDHHKVPEEELPALAFLNPHRPACGFPYKHMASVGLAFSVAAAVRQRLDASLDLRGLLDLVALGTVADVAPLDGDNRILTRAGLQRIGDGEVTPGVRALLAEVKPKFRLAARDISFQVTPLLNAPGRLGSAMPTLRLLLEDDPSRAASLARDLALANQQRKEISAQLIQLAVRQVGEVYGDALPAGIVVAGDGWHHGMGGIVAGRLVDRYNVAVAVVSLDGEEGVGSVRAPRGAKLFDAVMACKGDLIRCGGHDGAAGLSIRRDRIDAFRAGFADAMARQPKPEPKASRADVTLTEADLTAELGRDLISLEPTGEGNPEVVAEVNGALLRDARPVGEGHLRVTLALGRRTIGGFVRDGQARRERGEVPAVSTRVTAIGNLRLDPWSGPEAVQLEVAAIRAE